MLPDWDARTLSILLPVHGKNSVLGLKEKLRNAVFALCEYCVKIPLCRLFNWFVQIMLLLVYLLISYVWTFVNAASLFVSGHLQVFRRLSATSSGASNLPCSLFLYPSGIRIIAWLTLISFSTRTICPIQLINLLVVSWTEKFVLLECFVKILPYWVLNKVAHEVLCQYPVRKSLSVQFLIETFKKFLGWNMLQSLATVSSTVFSYILVCNLLKLRFTEFQQVFSQIPGTDC